MRIFLKSDYIGTRSQNKAIRYGYYDINDPRLMGLGEYLLRHDYAVVAADTPKPESKPAPSKAKKQDAD